jgi:HEXXH motif-containing protein
VDRSVAPNPSWLRRRVFDLPAAIAAELASRGLVAWAPEKEPAQLLQQAGVFIALVPSLAATAASVVRRVHLLRAAPGYDLSHSEPQWRTRVFVSVPERSDDIGALRLAESVLHEAMHLRLTNRENKKPLVRELQKRIKSPWRSDLRSYQGVLHGLFVFTCLLTYYQIIASKLTSIDLITHQRMRVGEIKGEIGSLDIAGLCKGLTLPGATLARKWYNLAMIE